MAISTLASDLLQYRYWPLKRSIRESEGLGAVACGIARQVASD